MKNKYILKSTINNSHRTICQDSQEVALDKIDSIFVKLIYKNMESNDDKGNGLSASHVKGLNILSRKSLFTNYTNDEAIKKYNKKANVNIEKNNINDVVLKIQQRNTQTLSKQLNTQIKRYNQAYAKHNYNTFDSVDFHGNNDSQEKRSISQNLIGLKNITFPLDSHDKHDNNDKDDIKNKAILVLVNPYKLRQYSFVIPEYLTLILNIRKTSKILVYCPLDLNSPLESSEINYLFPIVFNTETKLAAQIPLSIMDYPDFNNQKLRDFL